MLEGWLFDDFTARGFDHCAGLHGRFVVEVVLGFGDAALFTECLLVGGRVWCGGTVGGGLLGESSWDADHGALGGDTVGLERFGDVEVAFGPLAGWAIWAEKDHEDGCGDDEDEWNDEGNSPCIVWSETTAANERLVDCWHDEVGDSTTGVTPSTSQSVGCTDDILVEETSRPDLARHERTTEDTNEKSNGEKTAGVEDCRS